MKREIFLTMILVSFLFPGTMMAQIGCKVLLLAISDSYTGNCKDGLAEGTGQASGKDFYKGEFVKGLPDGKGTYIWKNGATYDGEWNKGMRDGYGMYGKRINILVK
jgi:hypothetical protein